MEQTAFTDYLSPMILTKEQKQKVYERFDCQIQKGLKKATNAEAEVKCYITYVQDLPTGNEVGKYLALDLGGTNFRVICVQLSGKNPDIMQSNTFELPEEIYTGTGIKLFDYIAKCLDDFLQEYKLSDSRIKFPLGFTFSFPCVQDSLNKARLVRWTKAFKVDDVVDQDVSKLLNEAIVRRGLPVECVAVINDTIGTLMACAHRTPNCRLGVIVGTGCNGCFVEPVDKVEMLDEQYKNKPEVIINAEWGAFGDKGSLDVVYTEFDKEVDEKSINRGTQIHEKMVSGMYMGDLVALVMAKAVEDSKIMENHEDKNTLLEKLHTQYCFKTKHISKLEADTSDDFAETKNVFAECLNVTEPSDEDCKKLKTIAECVSRRSADLVGINIAYLIARSGLPEVAVAIDGGVYKNHPNYKDYLIAAVKEMLPDKQTNFTIVLSEDGSGRGAAIVASTAVATTGGISFMPPQNCEDNSNNRQEYACCRCDDE